MLEPVDFNNLNYIIFKQNREYEIIGEKYGCQCTVRKAIIKFKNDSINVFYAGFLTEFRDNRKMIFENPVMCSTNKPSDEMLVWVKENN
jgi:hypothetical protein